MRRFKLGKLKAAGLAAALLPLFNQSCTIDVDGFIRPRSFFGVVDIFIDDDDDDFFDDLEDFFDDLDDDYDDFYDDYDDGWF